METRLDVGLIMSSSMTIHFPRVKNYRCFLTLFANRLMPLLGLCYMLTALDKSTLNYSTLLGLIADTVRIIAAQLLAVSYSSSRVCRDLTILGALPYSTLATWLGLSLQPIFLLDFLSENIWQLLCKSLARICKYPSLLILIIIVCCGLLF